MAMNRLYYELWHLRYDDWDRDYDKLLGIYSTEEKAEAGLALLRDKPGFRDHPDGFEINEGLMDETGMKDGFITLWGDEEMDAASARAGRPLHLPIPQIEEGPKDIPIWALSQRPSIGEDGGDFARRLMDEHYGRDDWSRDDDELDQLRKYCDRVFRKRPSLLSLQERPVPTSNMHQKYYSLWHRRTDGQHRDHDMLLGIYSTRAKAEEGLALLRDKEGFRNYPDAFEINEGRIDETYESEGFITVPGDAEPDANSAT
jgi:hypothetical protein